jgi:tight adherence protein B
VTPVTFWIGRATVAVVTLTLALVAFALFGTAESPGRKRFVEYAAGLDGKLRFLRWKLRGRDILAAELVLCVAILGAATGMGRWSLGLLVPIVVLGPGFLIERASARRVSRLEAQIEPWIAAIANALKASPSLGEAIASSISLVQSPMSEEVEVLVKESSLGTPLDEALDHLARRVGSRTLSGTALALKVARRSGGNLPEMLENAASALRELARLEGVVRTKTAEGKAQAFVIGVIPVPMVVGIHLMDPRFFAPLATSFSGNLVVAGAAALWAVAILLSRKILAVDV